MPTITFNLKSLNKYVGKQLSSKLLQERVPFLGTPIEAMDKDTMMIEVPPNRPDMLSLPGFARAFSTFIGTKKGMSKYVVKPSTYSIIIDESVKKIRPYTVCAVVKNLKFDDDKIKEIIDLQEKIHITYGRNRKKMAMGVYPLEKISFPIKYLAKKPDDISFIPLDFDKKLTAKQILALHPAGVKYASLLKDLKKYPLFVDAKNEILSMPPLINSHNVGKVTTDTKNIFIECSGFDFEYLNKALNMVVCALDDMGGEIYQVTIKDVTTTKTPDLKSETMAIKSEYVSKILGTTVSQTDLKNLLEKMGYGWNGKAIIPPYRADILHKIDLVEDIAIAYGYENLKEEIPKVASVGQEDPELVFQNIIRDIMIGAGLLEVKNFSISNPNTQNKKILQTSDLIHIEASFSEEYTVLRRRILPSLLDTLSKNKHREYPQNIFEIGTIFLVRGEIIERPRLSVTLCNSTSDFTKIKQIIQVMIEELKLNLEIVPCSKGDCPSLISGRAGKIMLEGKKIGFLGEVSPEVLENFDIDMPTSALEIDLRPLFKASRN